jgi:iron complex transport system substrate-binding protein
VAIKGLPKEPVVLSFDPTCLEDVFGDILRLGQATGTVEAARTLVESLRRRIDRVREQTALAGVRPRVAYLEWLDPPMYAGHWVPEMVEIAGGEDCLAKAGSPSSRVEWESVKAQDPDVILVGPCGFDVRRGLQELKELAEWEPWNSLVAVQKGQVYVVDANAYFSRSGPRLVQGLEMMAEVLHPELVAGNVPARAVARLYGRSF